MFVVMEQNNIFANSVLTWRHHLRHETVNNSLFCGRCVHVWRRGDAGLLVSPFFVKCNDTLQSAVYSWHQPNVLYFFLMHHSSALGTCGHQTHIPRNVTF